MRIPPRKTAGKGDGDWPNYVGRWPEQVSISDNLGGLIRDFRLILMQNLGLFAIVGIVTMYTLFVLWSLPPDVWFYALSFAYACGVLAVPYGMARIAAPHIKAHDDEGEGTGQPILFTVGTLALLVIAIALGVKFYDMILWDWLDTWTDGFFFFEGPAITAWAMAGFIMAFLTALFALLGAQRLTLAALFGTLGLMGYWLITAEWGLPPPHLYIILFAIDGALIFASWPSAQRLRREIMYPFWGSLQVEGDGEEAEEESLAASYRFRHYIGMQREQRAGLLPPGEIIEVTGPKGEEWLLSTANLTTFVEELPDPPIGRGIKQSAWKGVRMPAGLIMWDSNNNDVVIKDAPITQWEHWAPYRCILIREGIYGGKDFLPAFKDKNGQPDVGKILDELRL